MSIYDFLCSEHGVFEINQGMNAEHKAVCPVCKKEATRIFHPISFNGDLPCGKPKLGNTRNELFANLQKEGFAHKDWKKTEEQTTESLMLQGDAIKKEGL